MRDPVRDRELMASALELAGSGDPAMVDLATNYIAARRARAAATTTVPAAPVSATCGAKDDFGRCIEPYHSMDCASIVSDPMQNATFAGREDADEAWETARAERRAMLDRAARPFTDTAGRQFTDQHGDGVTLTGAIEASAGYVLRRGYGPQRPELCQPQRVNVHHRADDPGGLEGRGEETGWNPLVTGLSQEISPTPERPADLEVRRALAGYRPGVPGRHWADSYDDADLGLGA
jgi:hypothetical protein